MRRIPTPTPPARGRRPEDQALWVDQQIRAAMARGEFDNLPHAGKPLPHIDTANRPDWWLEQFIEREQITGVLPEALQLRKDDAALNAELDAMVAEDQVRRRLDEFNARVVAARRQLLGGPPVVTALRDVAAWRERRRLTSQCRASNADSAPAPSARKRPRLPRFRRRQ